MSIVVLTTIVGLINIPMDLYLYDNLVYIIQNSIRIVLGTLGYKAEIFSIQIGIGPLFGIAFLYFLFKIFIKHFIVVYSLKSFISGIISNFVILIIVYFLGFDTDSFLSLNFSLLSCFLVVTITHTVAFISVKQKNKELSAYKTPFDMFMTSPIIRNTYLVLKRVVTIYIVSAVVIFIVSIAIKFNYIQQLFISSDFVSIISKVVLATLYLPNFVFATIISSIGSGYNLNGVEYNIFSNSPAPVLLTTPSASLPPLPSEGEFGSNVNFKILEYPIFNFTNIWLGALCLVILTALLSFLFRKSYPKLRFVVLFYLRNVSDRVNAGLNLVAACFMIVVSFSIIIVVVLLILNGEFGTNLVYFNILTTLIVVNVPLVLGMLIGVLTNIKKTC
jgi:hypothetical protein